MSSTPPPAAPKAKPADLPDKSLEDDADSEKGMQQLEGLKTFDDDSPSTTLAALSGASLEKDSSTTSDDISEINVDEVHERNLALYNESILDRPLVDVVVPISELRGEYKNPAFIEQINWLEKYGYHSIRRIRGDGDCFYRAFGFAFVERFLHMPADANRDEAFNRVNDILYETLYMFDALSFDRPTYRESCFVLQKLLICIRHGPDEKTIRSVIMHQFQDLYNSNAIVYYLRLVTAAQIQLARKDYAPFLTNQDIPDSEEILEPEDFTARFVIPLGKEADDVQISALCRALRMNIDIAYVDGREDHNQTAQKVRFVPFRSDINKDAEPISLLYRPGHYDILVGKYHE